MIGWSLGQDYYSVLAQIDEPNLGQRALARTPRLDLFGRKDSDESGEQMGSPRKGMPRVRVAPAAGENRMASVRDAVPDPRRDNVPVRCLDKSRSKHVQPKV
jgi:hypothetical protein